MSPSAPLFDETAREAAERQGSDSHFRWLALSDDPEAVALRAALEDCFGLAGRGREGLRRALMHERWGQHAGALAHLLTLGLLQRQSWRVEVEPALGGQAPDILATQDAEPGNATDAVSADGTLSLLVEVRAVSGAGTFPWEARRENNRPLERDPERRAALTDSVARILARKAEIYRLLVEHLRLPYVICLYEDKDTVISELVRDIAFGRGAGDGTRDPDGGAFAQDRTQFGAVSAVIVFGRVDTASGELLLRGELIGNPHADVPLPDAARLPLLRRYDLDAGCAPRMRWRTAAQEFTLDGGGREPTA